jgi:hypothetical protein
MAVGLSEIICNFDVIKVIRFIKHKKKIRIILHYQTSGPRTGNTVPDFPFINVGYPIT